MEPSVLQLDQEAFSCAICLDLLRSPVTIPCGHSYCQICIKDHWDTEENRHEYSCPQCRQSVTQRPALVKNTMLAFLVEEMKKSRPAEGKGSMGDDHVTCDLCSEKKVKAVKSCLQCLVSYCQDHLQPHYDVAALQNHQLVAPCTNLQDSLCSEHHKVKEFFCRTDQRCICSMCSLETHQGHDITSASLERSQRQKELQTTRQNLLHKIQAREKDMDLLQQKALSINQSAQEALRVTGQTFTETIHLLENRRTALEQDIKSQQKIQEASIQELQDQAQKDITELRRTLARLDSLTLSPDHNHFLQLYPVLMKDSKVLKPSTIQTSPNACFKEMTEAMSILNRKLQLTLKQGKEQKTVGPKLLSKVHPKSRKDFLQYSQEITLDPNSVHTELSLTDSNTRVSHTGISYIYPAHPERFSDWRQAIGKEGLMGRCYWEVEWSAKEEMSIAVSYKDIKRKGRSCKGLLGHNDHSWAFYCDKNKGSFWFNAVQSKVSGKLSSRIGVYLDYSAGALSFYNVEDSMSLLHTVQATFNQPLYAAVGLYGEFTGDTAHFSKLK